MASLPTEVNKSTISQPSITRRYPGQAERGSEGPHIQHNAGLGRVRLCQSGGHLKTRLPECHEQEYMQAY